jgi:uncharacterized protein YdaU (DUF1376 family)
MCEFAYYKRYPRDIYADTRFLSRADRGSYNDLLDIMWLQGGRLRFDHAELARIAGVGKRLWLTVWGKLARLFTISEDGLWVTQKRLTAEIDEARIRRTKASGAVQAREAAKSLESNKVATGQDDPGSIDRAGATQSERKKDSSTDEIRGGAKSLGAIVPRLGLGPISKPEPRPLYAPHEIEALEKRFVGKIDDIPKRIPGLIFWATETEGMVSENEIKRAIYRALEKRALGKELEAERVAA